MRGVVRYIPPGALAALGGFAVIDGHALLALLCGAGIPAAWRGLSRYRDPRRKLADRARRSAGELDRVAREDRVGAPQARRLAALQGGLLEGWELLPSEYASYLEEDVRSVVGEVEAAAGLARRRAALRRHVEGMDRQGVARRIEALERDLESCETSGGLRRSFEEALEGRRGELAGYEEALDGISRINARLEATESLLSSLRGELLALDSGVRGGEDLGRIQRRISTFRRSLDEIGEELEGIGTR